MSANRQSVSNNMPTRQQSAHRCNCHVDCIHAGSVACLNQAILPCLHMVAIIALNIAFSNWKHAKGSGHLTATKERHVLLISQQQLPLGLASAYACNQASAALLAAQPASRGRSIEAVALALGLYSFDVQLARPLAQLSHSKPCNQHCMHRKTFLLRARLNC